MSAQHVFLKTHLPSFWPNLDALCVQGVSIWDDRSFEEKISSLFPDRVPVEQVREHKFLLLRSFHPGAANPVAQSLAMLLDIPEDRVRVDQMILMHDNRVEEDIFQRAQNLWREPAIETVRILKTQEWLENNSEPPIVPERKDTSRNPCEIGSHGLEFSAEESEVLKRRAAEMGRQWTRSELELIAQTWSEHCKHKIFAAQIDCADSRSKFVDSLFKTFIRTPALEISELKQDRYLSMFHDNAGVIALDRPDKTPTDWALCVKMETHNSPSAISPYGGASTGIVGVHRDILGTGIGAMPVFNWDVLCFEEPNHSEPRPEGALHPDVIRQGVIKGIEDGGNQSGIPTVQGSVVFHPRYAIKPLVYAGAVGLMPKSAVNKNAKAGQKLYSIGGAVGADGLRGAVMSSRDIRGEDFSGSMVQVANAFVQRRVTDFLLEARDQGLIQSLTDNGAGGFASSIGEMATQTGGARIDLSNIRCKFKGLHGWERLLSESQERMSVATAHPEAFEELARKWQLPFDLLGELSDHGRFTVLFNGETLVDIDLAFLHDACPQMQLKSSWTRQKDIEEIKAQDPEDKRLPDVFSDFRLMQESVHLASREGIVRRFDHEVQGRTLRQPFAGREQSAPQPGSLMELYEADAFAVLSHGLSPQRKDIFENVLHSWDECLRQALLSGARLETAGVLDNFSWPDPINHERYLWQLVRSCEILKDLSHTFEIPFISGKDSMKNNSKDFFVPPTLVVSLAASSCAPENVPASFFLRANDVVVMLPLIGPSLRDSAWERIFNVKAKKGRKLIVRSSDPGEQSEELRLLSEQLRERYSRVQSAVSAGLLRSARDISEGGLLQCVFEMCLGRNLGLIFESTKMDPIDAFSEGLGGFVFSIDPHFVKDVEALFPELKRLGVVHKVPELVWRPGQETLSVEELKEAYCSRSEAGFWGA